MYVFLTSESFQRHAETYTITVFILQRHTNKKQI